MLPFVLRCPASPSNRVVEPAQLALGAGIHIAHPADNRVGLVVQIKAIADQLLEFDLRSKISPVRRSSPAISATIPPFSTAVAPWTAFPAFSPGLPASAFSASSPGLCLTGRTSFRTFLLLCFCHDYASIANFSVS